MENVPHVTKPSKLQNPGKERRAEEIKQQYLGVKGNIHVLCIVGHTVVITVTSAFKINECQKKEI